MVTFDGENKLITATSGTTTIDVKEDLYSSWKEFVGESDNSKYLPAFRVVGGEPIEGQNTITPYFFLLNGWRFRPQEADHNLTVNGILLVDGGGEPIIPTTGTYRVLVNRITPIRAESVLGSSSTEDFTSQDRQNLQTAVNNSFALLGINAINLGK